MFSTFSGNNIALNVENCLFTGGTQGINAYSAYSSTIAISNSVFASCGSSTSSAAAVSVSNSNKAKPTKLTVKSTVFEKLLGNPICLAGQGVTASITGSTFKNNVGRQSGAVYATSSAGAVSLSGNTFKNNTCPVGQRPYNCKANGFCKEVSGSPSGSQPNQASKSTECLANAVTTLQTPPRLSLISAL